MDRGQCSYQFEIQAHRLGFSIKQRCQNYTYVLVDQQRGREVRAMVLVESFDFYTYRLNRLKQRVDLLVVSHHNAMVPLRVVSMGESRDYQPGTPPDHVNRETRQRRNQSEKKLFVSALLIGSKQALAELESMHIRARQRYLKMRDEYLKPRRGRPQAS